MTNKIENDKITVEELKMFVGTGLEFEVDEVNVLEAVLVTTCDGHEYTAVSGMGSCQESNEFQISCIIPIVRQLSQLTKEIEVDGERFVPIEKIMPTSESKNFGWMSDPYMKGLLHSAEIGCLPMNIANKLSSWHFDIFNWIGRGLAKELGE
jgi:hypothetical protein